MCMCECRRRTRGTGVLPRGRSIDGTELVLVSSLLTTIDGDGVLVSGLSCTEDETIAAMTVSLLGESRQMT